jgi:tetratricopeptide (TPR) repeat protein
MNPAQPLDQAMKIHRAGRLAEAEALYRQILAAEPGNARAMQLLGVIAFQSGNLKAGMELIQQAIRLNPNCADFHANLGVLLKEADDHAGAIQATRRAIALDPLVPDYHWNLSMSLLSLGQFKEGWDEFEWRLFSSKLALSRGLKEPRWAGQNLNEEKLLLHTEGGFGDAIQFIRYLPMIRQRVRTIYLECQPELVRLFEGLEGLTQIIPRGAAFPRFDFLIPLQSLPRVFQTDLSNMPACVPYLHPTAESVQKWKTKLAARPGKKIGLSWAGSRNPHDQRSRTLEIFAPLAEIPGLEFHSLQKGEEASQAVPPGFALIDHSHELRDFAETAGLVANLDLVISVDTSVVHLAGAMAKPVWTLLPPGADFRWLRVRDDTPWYPTMKLFRQKKRGDWSGPIQKVAEQLRAYVAV